MPTRRTSLALAACVLSITAVSFGQKRLGPKNRDTILDASLDPGFASTPLSRIVFLPFVNELDHPEGAMIMAETFIGGMRQNHPNISILNPQSAVQMIQDHKLGDTYRAFMGNYANTGVATMSFLTALPQSDKVDGVILGRILRFGINNNTVVFGGFSWTKSKATVGMEIMLLRTKDGRELWRGIHGVQGTKNENVRDLAKIVGDVFGRYFGRVPY